MSSNYLSVRPLVLNFVRNSVSIFNNFIVVKTSITNFTFNYKRLFNGFFE